MTIAIQLFINILIPTALLGLIAAGFSLFYAVSRIQHIAIGASVSSAGYTLLILLKGGVPFSLAILFAIAVAILIGLLSNALVYERLQGQKRFSVTSALIASVVLLLALQSMLLILFGSQPKTIPLPLAQTRFEFAGSSITILEIIALLISFTLIGGLALYLKKSRLGVAIRATSDNPEVAQIIGINVKRIRYFAMIIVSALAAVAGILIALEYNLEPYGSTLHAVKAFGRTIVGGVGSIFGVLVSGIIIDGAENLGAYFISSSYKEVVSFVIIFLFLLLRPQGLFGQKKD